MPARLRLALFIAGLLAVAALAGVLSFAVGDRTATSAGFSGAVRPAGIPPAEFGLRDERGKPVALRDMRGRPVVVTFLYTTCRDTCPLTMQQIRAGLDDLGHDVPVVAVSVDPANDTPRRARAFARRQQMAGRMRWVLGTSAQLQRLWRAFGVAPQSAEEEHSASTVLLDGRGRQRVGFETSVLTPEGLAHDIAALERERQAVFRPAASCRRAPAARRTCSCAGRGSTAWPESPERPRAAARTGGLRASARCVRSVAS